jgi:hypothetical protein
MNIKMRLWLSGLCAAAILFAACDTVGGTNNTAAAADVKPPVPGEITAFSIGDNDGIIDGEDISVVVPQDADLTELAPEITLDTEEAEVVPASGEPQDFTGSVTEPLEYIVSAHKTYKVTVENAGDGSGERAITEFTVTIGEGEGVKTYTGTIDEAKKTITVIMPYGQSFVSISPVIKLSDKAVVTPASGTAQNFSTSNVAPVFYTVTAENRMQARYKVSIMAEGQGSADSPLGMPLTLSPVSLELPASTLKASISANTGFDSYLWTIDDVPLQANGRLININREDYIIGPHNLSVTAYKNGVPFNAKMTFEVIK